MNVAVVGSGRGGYALAADLTLQGHRVTFCAGDRIADGKAVAARGGLDLLGVLGDRFVPLEVEGAVERAVANADLIAVPVPGSVQGRYADLLRPHLSPGQALWFCQGGGASLLPEVRPLRERHLLIETLYLPYSARRTGVTEVSVRARLRVPYSSFPAKRLPEAARLLGGLADLPQARNVLEIALQNVNAIIQPLPSLLNLGRIEREHGDVVVTREGMTPGVLRCLELLDRERVAVCAAARVSALSIDEVYGLLGFRPPFRSSPASATGRGETFEDRFVTEAVPVGLVTIASAGRQFGVPVPLAEATIALSDALYRADSWRLGRTMAQLGLGGMAPEQVERALA